MNDQCHFCGVTNHYLWRCRIITEDNRLITIWCCPLCQVKHHDEILYI